MMHFQHFYDRLSLDRDLFLFINSLHTPLLDQMMVLLSGLGDPVMFPYYMLGVLLLAWKKPETMPLRNVLTFSLSFVLTSALLVPAFKIYFNFPRPATVFGEHAITILGNPSMIHSFPSGHAAFAVLLALSLRPNLPRGGQFALLGFALMVCLSRISVGAHFPGDVIAGAAIAALVVWLIQRLLPRC